MKLYTEEQIRGLVMALCDYNILKEEVAMRELTPIKLPSDMEIEKVAEKTISVNLIGFIKGAKWMKEQILNQNK